MNNILGITLLILSMPLTSHATETPTSASESTPTSITCLSKELRSLLSQEMNFLEKGMKDIMTAYISGDWQAIKVIATQMKNSYILKQNLTQQQMHQLHTTLPASFLKQDQQFHYFAGMLSHAAEMKKAELIGFYYAKMSGTCVSCHRQHALHRFPQLAPIIEKHQH
jgi:hypothetical protein